MRAPGHILLISCYELGHQPMGLALPLGHLERAGFSPAGVDISVEPFDSTLAAQARLAALSVPMHTALRLGSKVARAIRRASPGCHICFHGHYAMLNSDFLLDSCADSVLSGECEESLVHLARCLEERGDLRSVPGLNLRGRAAPPILTRQDFATPSRRGLRALTDYARLEMDGETRLAGYVEASRGCLHHCRHCPIPAVYGGRFFVVPQERVLEDIRHQIDMGARHITFGDPDFLNGPGHSLAIVRAMHDQHPGLTFDFTAKIEHLLRHRDRLRELRELGAVFVVSAVETLSDEILRILDKGHTRDDVFQALDLCRRAGLTLRPSLIPFTPWSTLADYGALLDFIAAQELVEAVDPVQLTVRLLIPPGSLLLGRPELAGRLGALDPESLSYPWRHSDHRMDRLQRDAAASAERGARQRDPAALTFARIRNDFAELRGTPRTFGRGAMPRAARRLPRLTESWFC